jgi:hypothetical protein
MAGENYINHVVFVLDASSSMDSHRESVVKVMDDQVKHLAEQSKALDQETRVSIYVFANDVRCLVYDKDVLRLPSIGTLYRVGGMTALIDASLKSLEDLSKTPELYGDHAFLVYVVTDGAENRSRCSVHDLRDRLRVLPDHWTVATLVPDAVAKSRAQAVGFAPANIAVWDTTGSFEVEVGSVVRAATDNFMQARSRGERGSKSLFTTGSEVVNAQSVHGTLAAIPEKDYDVIRVHEDNAEIRDFVISRGLDYRIGNCFYQLVRRTTASGYAHASEKVQAEKQILVREKATGKLYGGPEARQLLGLPNNQEVRVRPGHNPDYDVFIQSTSVNRQLVLGTDIVVLRSTAGARVLAGATR